MLRLTFVCPKLSHIMRSLFALSTFRHHIQNNAYLWVCFAMIVGVMGTALASPLYPIYQTAWQLTAGDITILYVIYMASALSSLLFLGRLSDQKGFVFVLRVGLILITTGIFLSAIAWSYTSFLISRIFIGLASSLIVTSASIGLTKLSRSRDLQRAAATTSLLIAFGFGVGPVMGGLIAQWAHYPLRSSYFPSMIMGLIAIYAMFLLPAAPHQPQNPPKKACWWRPSLHIPSAQARTPFFVGACAAFAAFSMFSLFASLAPSFMDSMVPWHGPAVSGLSIGIILFMSSGFQLWVRQWPLKRSLLIGLFAFSTSNLLLIANLQHASVLLFASSLILTAMGHGLCLISGMGIVNRIALPEHRAATTSSYLIIAYLGAIVPILALGFLADLFSMPVALVCFCFGLFIFSSTLGVLAFKKLRLPALT